jgi:hypothetical protein
MSGAAAQILLVVADAQAWWPVLSLRDDLDDSDPWDPERTDRATGLELLGEQGCERRQAILPAMDGIYGRRLSADGVVEDDRGLGQRLGQPSLLQACVPGRPERVSQDYAADHYQTTGNAAQEPVSVLASHCPMVH